MRPARIFLIIQLSNSRLWPEMKDMIHEYGGKNYSIFLDKGTLTLFGYIEIEDEKRWSESCLLYTSDAADER